MKEHFQDYGARKWAGDDLIELQSEPLAALQALVSPYAPCIVSGCETRADDGGGYTVSAGLVALPGKDVKGNECVKIVRTDSIAMADNNQVCYLTLQHQTLTRTYGDGTSKAIAYNYVAQQTTIKPEDTPYLEIAANGGRRLVDTLGITQKLDREGGDATDVKVTFAEPSADQEPGTLQSGTKLGTLISQIKGWLSALKKELGNKVDKEKDKVLSSNDFTDEFKEKLKVIDDNANKYTHPSYQAHDSGLYKITVDAQGHVSAIQKVNKSDITALGIPGQDTDTVYSHPTSEGNKHIPSGGSSGKYLKWSSSGTAAWVQPTASEIGAATTATATTSANGLMSAADKSKLDGIAKNANNFTYTHPNLQHIPSGGETGKFLGYSSSGTASWQNLPIKAVYRATMSSTGTFSNIVTDGTLTVSAKKTDTGRYNLTITNFKISTHFLIANSFVGRVHFTQTNGSVMIDLYSSISNNAVDGTIDILILRIA